MVSSSGGHFNQLKCLKPLGEKYDMFWVTEKTKYHSNADYYLLQTGLRDWCFPFKMTYNFIKSLILWLKEKPDCVITTGSMVALPAALLSKLFRKKLIYIETFARVHDGTKTGKVMYKLADLFIIQWESLSNVYPKATYGGSIY